jgi:hypothetical protein
MRAKKKDTNNTVTVYWSPGRFNIEQESWNMLYSEPFPLINDIFENTYKDAEIRKCPGIRSALKNVFTVKANHNENIEFPSNYLEKVNEIKEKTFPLDIPSIIEISKQRNSEYLNRVNLLYNMSWYFFASEPLEAKMTSPYYPSQAPTYGSALFPGQFNIGLWYRPFNLEYSIPLNAKSFQIKPNDDLFYLEFKTDKKIVFQRYNNTKSLDSLAAEFTSAPKMFGFGKTLAQRYDLAKRTQITKIVLSEIQKNIVDPI